jgi:hypothetical protein
VGNNAKKGGGIFLGEEGDEDVSGGSVGLVTAQPSKKDTPRYQAILAAVQAG